MVGGFATIAGSVLGAYVNILGGTDEVQRVEFIKHLLTASVIAAPAAFVMARIIVPERESPPEENLQCAPPGYEAANVFDAATHGASEGLRLALNVGAMLIAFIALLALLNWPLEAIGEIPAIRSWLDARGVEALRLEVILGWLFMPLAWLMGVERGDASEVGSLLGQKLILTEFVAYMSLGEMMHAPGGAEISTRSAKIAAYALCGFANFASIGIQIGGLTVLAPERRRDIVSLGLRAMLGGAIASCMSACIASMIISS
jgi:CNT family concentrative nucleoside transporter